MQGCLILARGDDCKGYREDHYHCVISTLIDTSRDMVSYILQMLQDTAMSYYA